MKQQEKIYGMVTTIDVQKNSRYIHTYIYISMIDVWENTWYVYTN